MSNASRFDSISLTNQAVLLGLADLASEGETPVQTHDVRRHCKQRLSDVDTEVVGTISEADVIRSLYRLEEEELVEEVPPAETSPTGKGRPAYALAVESDAVYDGVVDELVEGTRD
ncbi:hypothetical protein C488_09589 [Natrinema pellirubrum DSM 15624]|uniref:Uncharacterized protein n=1 Tax=Natrinema pellirubrum (strain DSM 15624 / CIP 106293 / JCM 10476 / NCIMB 786 / 157) TaxID=797303 RepID=L0JPY9_NATP1|nr:hypothetical protein [Natrinema pellirubrum]AGB32893.1 hypothetical protein Natpe_3100 [Natrinema pellirubrum DSM 15624]ELY75653.1 hypothetical protein C488_09589 [Natrinema pellirubrum DSM 15624]